MSPGWMASPLIMFSQDRPRHVHLHTVLAELGDVPGGSEHGGTGRPCRTSSSDLGSHRS